MAFGFDGFEIGEGGAGEAAGFFEKVCVFGGEFTGAFVENFDDALSALGAGKGDDDRGFDAGAAGFVEMLEVVGGDFLAADAAGFGGFVDFGEEAFADGFALWCETFSGFVPAGAADKAFGIFGRGAVGPDEYGAGA